LCFTPVSPCLSLHDALPICSARSTSSATRAEVLARSWECTGCAGVCVGVAQDMTSVKHRPLTFALGAGGVVDSRASECSRAHGATQSVGEQQCILGRFPGLWICEHQRADYPGPGWAGQS